METFNTTSPRQKINEWGYRGSYTQHLTVKQFQAIMSMTNLLNVELEDVWEAWFDEDYQVGNWRNISLNAASEIIDHLYEVRAKEVVVEALMRKIQRTEQEQHEWEMYPDGKL